MGFTSARHDQSGEGIKPSPTTIPSHAFGWRRRQVIARTSSQSCKAVVALSRCTALETQRRRRWESTSFAEA